MKPVFILALCLPFLTPPAFATPSDDLSGGEPAISACGENAWEHFIPEGPFTAACQAHDECYNAPLLDQGRCDMAFLTDMRAACDTAYPQSQLSHGACQSAAYIYFRAVNSRLGAMHYPNGRLSGALTDPRQTRLAEADGSDELVLCTDIVNTSNRKLNYILTLHDSDGQWIDSEPDLGKLSLQPDERRNVCVDTNHVIGKDWNAIGPAYAVTLQVDDPATLNPFGDLVPLTRFDCDKATGSCMHAAP